jgi:hypothetical protein
MERVRVIRVDRPSRYKVGDVFSVRASVIRWLPDGVAVWRGLVIEPADPRPVQPTLWQRIRAKVRSMTGV